MAVFTPLTEADITGLLDRYDIGALKSFEGIAEGVENSNFLLNTEQGKFILTLFEKRVNEADLPYYLSLMSHMQAHGIHCPKPVMDENGQVLARVKDRPAVIITFLEGKGVREPQMPHMAPFGGCVAQMHKAVANFALKRQNALALPGWRALAEKIGARADEVRPGLARLIQDELGFLAAHWPKDLPQGAVHADLFPDNVFFSDHRITGVIDFYFACEEAYAYDFAICANAWCFDAAHRFQPAMFQAFLNAYLAVRKFTPAEKRALPVLCRGAALRFLLTRTHDLVFHPPGALVTPKDPLEYLAKLEFFQEWKGL